MECGGGAAKIKSQGKGRRLPGRAVSEGNSPPGLANLQWHQEVGRAGGGEGRDFECMWQAGPMKASSAK